MNDKQIDMNEHQLPTSCIVHLADSANFKGSTFNKNCNGLMRNRFEMPNVSYTHPLPPSVGNRNVQIICYLKK